MNRPRLAITGLTGCSGCQLTLLNSESDLPLLMERFAFAAFPLAGIPLQPDGRYDVALVEGCCSTPHEEKLLRELRRRSLLLIALGSCAAWGGVPASCNPTPRSRLQGLVHGGAGQRGAEYLPRPVGRVVKVDATLPGCPPEPVELLRFLGDIQRGVPPLATTAPVCSECRMLENRCLLSEGGVLCLGPVTLGGCGARCPARGVACEGCRGPAPEANLAELDRLCRDHRFDRQTVEAALRRFCGEWDDERRA